MPDAFCSTCRHWTERQRWAFLDEQLTSFRLACPRCGADADIADVTHRLGARQRRQAQVPALESPPA